MKSKNLIPFVLIVGIIILYFFPSPEENFLIYLGVILFFVIIFFAIKDRVKSFNE